MPTPEPAGPSEPGAGRRADPGFSTRLVAWQRTHGRHTLPWQNTRDPYRVWLSEIMLQQTQVATVLGYYARFLARFPDVDALAAASLDDVFALWSGLGYYTRARNLHACAQAVVTRHGGRFPGSSAALMTLPGIGRSTAAAIAAFCFGERVAILDGNVKRVLTRVLAFDGDLAEARQERALWHEATALLPGPGIEPEPEPGSGPELGSESGSGSGRSDGPDARRPIERYTQGLMDLGATLCSVRAPACLLCPVREDCAAARAGTQERYPVKTRKLKRGKREHVWLWLARAGQSGQGNHGGNAGRARQAGNAGNAGNGGQAGSAGQAGEAGRSDHAGQSGQLPGDIWLEQRPATGVWAGLWSLPEFESQAAFEAASAAWPGHGERLPSFTHVLTHLDWTLHPVRWTLTASMTEAQRRSIEARWPSGRWFGLDEALAAGLPSPLRKLLLLAAETAAARPTT